MADRFDLEQALMDCWHTSDDIEMILTSVESDDPPSSSRLIFLLQGLKELHTLRASRAFEIFEEILVDLEPSLSSKELPKDSPSVKQEWTTRDYNSIKKPCRGDTCYKDFLAQNRDYKN